MSISAFAIATQSPGHVEFTMLSDSQTAPSNLNVVNHQVDGSQVVNTEKKDVEDWVEHSQGWLGRVAFDQDSGIKCFASLHKGGSPNALGVISYTSP